MKRYGIIAILALAIGCAPKPTDEPNSQTQQSQPTAQNNPQPPQQPNQGGVTPVMPGAGAGPMTPVTGTENVQGSGGGSVGMAAKDMAKRSAAGQQNQQLPTDDTE